MKKLFFIAAIAGVALVSCVKNEVIPVNEEGQEITYLTSPVTKGVFDDDNVFESWAFYTPTDWDTDIAIANVNAYGNLADKLIKWDSTNSKWWNKDGEHFYWPKAGKLTFFSYSLNSASTNDAVMCSTDKGIYVDNYNVNTNKNVDFLVADIAKDLGARVVGTNNVEYPEVSTLFRHKLTNIVFDIKTKNNYSATQLFKLVSIKFIDINHTGNYSQLPDDKWTGQSGDGVITFSEDNIIIDDTLPNKPVATQSIYLPQTLNNDKKVQIKYTVAPIANTSATTEYTHEIPLTDIFGTGSEWLPGTKYTITVTVGLNEIFWAPEVQEWTSGSGTDFGFEIN